MSEIVPDVYGQAVVAYFGAFGLECVAEEFAAPEQVAAADVVAYAQVSFVFAPTMASAVIPCSCSHFNCG